MSNNAWPRKITPSRVELFKSERGVGDLMKDFNTPLKSKDAKDAKDAKDPKDAKESKEPKDVKDLKDPKAMPKAE